MKQILSKAISARALYYKRVNGDTPEGTTLQNDIGHSGEKDLLLRVK